MLGQRARRLAHRRLRARIERRRRPRRADHAGAAARIGEETVELAAASRSRTGSTLIPFNSPWSCVGAPVVSVSRRLRRRPAGRVSRSSAGGSTRRPSFARRTPSSRRPTGTSAGHSHAAARRRRERRSSSPSSAPSRGRDVPEPIRSQARRCSRCVAAPLNPVDLGVASGTVLRRVAAGALRRGGRGSRARARVATARTGDRSSGPACRVSASTETDVRGARRPLVRRARSACRTAPIRRSPRRSASPGLAAWLPLAWRAPVQPDETVLVLGATGTLGLVAVQAAKILGAGRVVAAGRSAERPRARARGGGRCDRRARGQDGSCGGAEGGLRRRRPDARHRSALGEPARRRARGRRTGCAASSRSASRPAPRQRFPRARCAARCSSCSATRTCGVPHDVLADGYSTLVDHAVAGRIRVDLEQVPLDQARGRLATSGRGCGREARHHARTCERHRPGDRGRLRRSVSPSAGRSRTSAPSPMRSPTTTASRSRPSASSRQRCSSSTPRSRYPPARRSTRSARRRVGLVALLVVAATNALALSRRTRRWSSSPGRSTGVGTALGFVAGIDYVRAHGGIAVRAGALRRHLRSARAGVALAIVPQREDWLGWRAPFVTSLVVAGGAAVLLAARPEPTRRALRPERHADVPQVPGVPARRRLYRLCVVYMASFGLSIVLGNWVVTLLTRAGGLREAAAGAVGSLILLGGRRQPAARRRRWPAATARGRGLILGASFVACAIGAAVLAIAGPLALSAAGALLVGLAAGIPFAACFAAAARIRPDAPAAAIGNGQHVRESRHRLLHAARRAHLLPAWRRPHRLRSSLPGSGLPRSPCSRSSVSWTLTPTAEPAAAR